MKDYCIKIDPNNYMKDFCIKIKDNEWQIIFADNVIVRESEGKNTFHCSDLIDIDYPESVYGICDNDNKIIAISTDDVDENEMRITLLHEIVHAISHEYDVDMDEYKTEEIANILNNVIKIILDSHGDCDNRTK